MLGAARPLGGTIGVVKFAGIGAAHFRQNTIQRLYARGARSLSHSRSGKTDGESRYDENKTQAHGRFLALFK